MSIYQLIFLYVEVWGKLSSVPHLGSSKQKIKVSARLDTSLEVLGKKQYPSSFRCWQNSVPYNWRILALASLPPVSWKLLSLPELTIRSLPLTPFVSKPDTSPWISLLLWLPFLSPAAKNFLLLKGSCDFISLTHTTQQSHGSFYGPEVNAILKLHFPQQRSEKGKTPGKESGLSWGLSGKRLCLPIQETRDMCVWSLGQEDPLEEEMATHSSVLAWRIPWKRSLAGFRQQSQTHLSSKYTWGNRTGLPRVRCKEKH